MIAWPAFVTDWNSTAAERARRFPCDELIAEPDLELYRAVDIVADTTTVFRWLCQLRAAPYSYDLLDNGGRRSPQQLTPGLERLEAGQRVMRVFRLVGFEEGRSMTVLSEGRLFGRVACTYDVEARGPERSRLFVKLLVARPPGASAWWARAAVLAPGDLVMMRRQLLNLKRLAEAGLR
jgi:hypothetical protein